MFELKIHKPVDMDQLLGLHDHQNLMLNISYNNLESPKFYIPTLTVLDLRLLTEKVFPVIYCTESISVHTESMK